MTLFPFESVKQQNKGIGRKKRQVWQLVKSSEGLSVPLSHKQGQPVAALWNGVLCPEMGPHNPNGMKPLRVQLCAVLVHCRSLQGGKRPSERFAVVFRITCTTTA